MFRGRYGLGLRTNPLLRGNSNRSSDMPPRITREIVEIAALMQVKALAFDSEHPNNPLGTSSPATYASAIRALVSENEEQELGKLILEASARAMQRLLLSHTDRDRPM